MSGNANAGQLRRVRIAGLGMYVPEKVLTNADLERLVDTSDDWIVSRTGIRERRLAAPPGAAATGAAARARRPRPRRRPRRRPAPRRPPAPPPPETTATMAAIAGKRALAVAGLRPDDLDCIL